jgi:hypothetical protein
LFVGPLDDGLYVGGGDEIKFFGDEELEAERVSHSLNPG